MMPRRLVRLKGRGWLPVALVMAYMFVKNCEAAGNCPHPSVPFAAKYSNLTGGPDQPDWKVKYICDSGFVLFGQAERACQEGQWDKEVPQCAVNVAKFKPTLSSSQTKGGEPSKAVDGRTSTVHEGNKCTETESEKSPWWTVDLLVAFPVHFVRLTTRCCDDIKVKKAEVRVGNFTSHKENLLCHWIAKELPEGETTVLECEEHIVGRYVSVAMTGVEAVLSLCEVEVFSPMGLAPSSCEASIPDDEGSVFMNSCYRFTGKEVVFPEATKECEKTGYHLVDHLDEVSVTFLTKRLETERISKGLTKKEQLAWIGAKRSDESRLGTEVWDWVSGGRVSTLKWGRGQPNNYNQEQNCAVLDYELDWGWNDISCKVNAQTICMGEVLSCPNPETNEGTYTSGSLKVGDTMTFHCPVGEMPVGEVHQTCLAEGRWSGDDPISCEFVDCGHVPGLADGEVHIVDGRTTWGARVRYKCKEDFSLMGGDEERTCLKGGWSGSQPSCIFVKCPDPPEVANADLVSKSKSPFTLGDALTYACKEGHKAVGQLTRECQKGGSWSGTTPACEFVDCGQPKEVEHGNFTLVNARSTFGGAVEYTCDPDYIPVGEKRKVCEENGQWTSSLFSCNIIKCPIPKGPNGGKVSGFNTVHSTIEYFCLPGHVLEGEETSVCLRTGLWSNRPPSCRYVDCGEVSNVEKGTLHYINGTTIGSVIRYSCDKSHTLIGDETRECLSHGKWSNQPPSCSEITCALPSRPENTVISVSSTERLHGTSVIRSKQNQENSYRVGSTLKYRCERGFILESENGTVGDTRVLTRRCTTSGTWTGGEPTCKFVDCGLPETIKNGDFVLHNNGTYFGSLVTHTCKDHFKLDGFERRRCDTSGKWEPEAPSCKETLCKNLTTPANGSMILTTLRIGGRASFQCDYGFNLKGDDDIECLSSGSWSSWPPSCLEIDCGQPHEIENGRFFMPLSSTKINSKVEYHCFPGFERDGPFERTCGQDGYWSGPEPKCLKPVPAYIPTNISEGDRSSSLGRSGTNFDTIGETNNPGTSSNVGVYIGVALGLIVVVGLMFLGIYYYRRQKALANKPPAPYRDRNSNGVSGLGAFNGFSSSSIYNHNGNASTGLAALPTTRTAGIMPHPPRQPMPPIQMYSMDESANSTPRHDEHRGPIYDTINDDSSAGSGYTRSHSGSGMSTSSTTFGPPLPAANGFSGFKGSNGSFVPHDYDIPEGSDHGSNSRPTIPVASVTINGIAV